jgi:Ca2+-binding RTX toxin-like protein
MSVIVQQGLDRPFVLTPEESPTMVRFGRLVTVLAVAGCSMTVAGVAQARPLAHPAAAAPFGCRASVARVALLGGTLLEPAVANAAGYPCQDASAAVSTLTIPPVSPILTVGPAGSFTNESGSAGGATAPAAAAVTQVQAVTISAGATTISVVGPVEAQAAYQCVNDQVVGTGRSTLDVLTVNGHQIALPSPGAPLTIPLGGGSFIAVNLKLQSATAIEERILEVHLAGIADIVVGEAAVSVTGAGACAGTSPTPSSIEICPPGSTLDAARQQCVIVIGGVTIVVSRPFQGPTGGTVVALSVARRRYKSPCLSGRGPRYVLVATKRGGRVTGTPQSDRILGLGAGERIAGLGGNDCIDGKGGGQTVFDGNGNDRIYTSGGSNRIGVGNGNDSVTGRNGSDRITVGNGNSVVHGGRGNSRIDVGLGHDRVFGGPGRNRIFAGGAHAIVSCGSGRHNVAFLRRRPAAYARSHGCQTIHLLK